MTGRGTPSSIDSRSRSANGNAFLTFGSSYTDSVVGARPPSSAAIDLVLGLREALGRLERELGVLASTRRYPRLIPPSGDLLGLSLSMRG